MTQARIATAALLIGITFPGLDVSARRPAGVQVFRDPEPEVSCEVSGWDEGDDENDDDASLKFEGEAPDGNAARVPLGDAVARALGIRQVECTDTSDRAQRVLRLIQGSRDSGLPITARVTGRIGAEPRDHWLAGVDVNIRDLASMLKPDVDTKGQNVGTSILQFERDQEHVVVVDADRPRAPLVASAVPFAALPSLFGIPQGLQRSNAGNLKVFFISRGDVGSEKAMKMIAVNETGKPVTLSGDLVVLQPLARLTPADVEREIQKSNGRRSEVNLPAFCLNKDKVVPRENQVYVFAPRDAQRAAAPMRRIMQAARILDAQKAFPPDLGDPVAYREAIKQWAVWTREKRYNERTFGSALIDSTKKNAQDAGQRWTPQLEQSVRQLIPGRWRDINRVLARADALDRALRTAVRRPAGNRD